MPVLQQLWKVLSNCLRNNVQLQAVTDILLQPQLDEHYSLGVNVLTMADFRIDLVHTLLESPSEALLLMDAALIVSERDTLERE